MITDNKLEQLMEILEDIDEDVDFDKEERLIDDHILDSFAVISLVSEIEDAFDIEIEAAEMVPENFNSAKAMWKMITNIQES